jgi:hypothetical protein
MAVIKIVPMPGAVGDKGDEGAVGPQGPQGAQGLQGPAGADALWSYNGEYNPGAGYAVGDVVTFDGQLWYRKNANGGNVGDTPSEGLFWDLLAAKGEGAEQLNFWNFVGDPGVPPENGALVVDGISARTGGNVVVFAEGGAEPEGSFGKVVLAGSNGEFLNDSNVPENQIATVGDLANQLNYWDGIEQPNPYQPAEPGILVIDGITRNSSQPLYIGAADKIYLTANNGEFINDPNVPSNQIATIGDVESQLNYWDGVSVPQDPAQNGFLIVDGIVSGPGSNILVSADQSVFIGGNNGEYLNGLSTPENQIATIGDISNAAPVETSFTVNGGTLGTQPTFDGAPLFSGTYVINGPMVHFQIQVDMDNILTFGNGQYFIDLPFPAKYGYQFKEGCLHDISSGKQYAIGGHVYAGQSQMGLTFTNSAGQDEAFDFNSPVTLNVADNFHISGTYISE